MGNIFNDIEILILQKLFLCKVKFLVKDSKAKKFNTRMGYQFFLLIRRLLGIKMNVGSCKLFLGLVHAQNGGMFCEHMPSHGYCFMIFIICDEVLVKVGITFSNFLFNIMANNTSHLLLQL